MEEKTYKILILEDDPDSIRFYEMLFVQLYDITIFDNLEDAQTAIENNFYHLFIVDIALKGKRTGLDFIRMLRSHNKYRNTPIICYTAYVSLKDRREAIEAGCNLFLEKPVYKEILLTSVKSLLDESNAGK